MKKPEEPYILVRGCRCSVLGQQNRTDICHHSDKPCHVFVNENERCLEEIKVSLTK